MRQELITKEHESNCIQIKERLQNPTPLSMMFLAELDKYCTRHQAEVGVLITQLTANKYHRVLRYLKEYITTNYRKDDLLLPTIDYEFIDGFNTFLNYSKSLALRGGIAPPKSDDLSNKSDDGESSYSCVNLRRNSAKFAPSSSPNFLRMR